jgi:RHS repeat-associated protein
MKFAVSHLKLAAYPLVALAVLTALSVSPLPPAMAQTQTTTFDYDRQGNRTSVTDGVGNSTKGGYDALNRPINSTDPDAKRTQISYDPLDRIRQIIDPRNLTTRYEINNLGDRTGLVSPDTGPRNARFDEGGNLVEQTDARGVVATHSYDELNRLTRTAWQRGGKGAPQAVPNQYIYDQGVNGIGRLTGLIDESGQTDFAYDRRGRMTSQVQTISGGQATGQSPTLATAWEWGKIGNTTGHLVSLTYPSGNRLEMTYDTVGRVQSITLRRGRNSTPLLGDIGYNHFAGVNRWTWGNGSSYAREYDLDGRVASYPLGDASAGGVVRTLTFDAAGRVRVMSHTGTLDAPRLDQRFDYDKLHRLTQFSASSQSQGFSYDASGNRTGLQQGTNSFTNEIDPASNRLQRSPGPVEARNFTYDAEGNPQTDGQRNFEFAPNGRLRSVSSPVGNTTYWYNAIGQRVKKEGAFGIAGQDITYYVYDFEGQLLGEYDRDGNPIQETVYLNGMPVVVLKPEQGETVPYYVYADHLNTARVITRASDNAMVWRWDQADPFGVAQPDQSPTEAAAFVYNPRFPGQVFDAESGLHQNYYRDYSPQDGKYLTSDPIGLAGGVNTYLYVGGDPLINIDPFGLLQQCRTGLDKLNGYGTSTPLHHEYSCWPNKDGTRSCRGFGRDPNSGTFDAMLNRVPGKVLKDNENVSHGREQCDPDDKNECMNQCVGDFYLGLEKDTSAYSWIRSSASQCQQMNGDIVTTCSQYCSAKNRKP